MKTKVKHSFITFLILSAQSVYAADVLHLDGVEIEAPKTEKGREFLRDWFDKEGTILRKVADGELEPSEAVAQIDANTRNLQMIIYRLNCQEDFFKRYARKTYSTQELQKIIDDEQGQIDYLQSQRRSTVNETVNLKKVIKVINAEHEKLQRLVGLLKKDQTTGEEADTVKNIENQIDQLQTRQKSLEEAVDKLNSELDIIPRRLFVAYKLLSRARTKTVDR